VAVAYATGSSRAPISRSHTGAKRTLHFRYAHSHGVLVAGTKTHVVVKLLLFILDTNVGRLFSMNEMGPRSILYHAAV